MRRYKVEGYCIKPRYFDLLSTAEEYAFMQKLSGVKEVSIYDRHAIPVKREISPDSPLRKILMRDPNV